MAHRPFFVRTQFYPILDRFDIGVGDRFYDDSRAYDMPWSEALAHVRRSLIVTLATRGEIGAIRYQISHWDGTNWRTDPEAWTTQAEFLQLLRIVP